MFHRVDRTTQSMPKSCYILLLDDGVYMAHIFNIYSKKTSTQNGNDCNLHNTNLWNSTEPWVAVGDQLGTNFVVQNGKMKAQ